VVQRVGREELPIAADAMRTIATRIDMATRREQLYEEDCHA
jgi:hypothetical protein